MIKEEILEYQERRTNERVKYWYTTVFPFPLELSKVCLRVKTKIIF